MESCLFAKRNESIDMFVMGMSIPYALERRYAKGYSGETTLKHIISRTVALLLMGVFIVNTEGGFDSTLGYDKNVYRVLMVAAFFLIWNAYPSGMKAKKWLQAIGVAILAFLALTFRTPEGGLFKAQWWGILGLIGWTYFFCAITYMLLREKPVRIFYIWIVLIILNILLTAMRGGGRIIEGPSFISDMTGVLHLGNAAWAIMATGGMMLSLAERRFSGRSACPCRGRIPQLVDSLETPCHTPTLSLCLCIVGNNICSSAHV